MDPKFNKTILVAGVTGRQGGAVARSLLCAGWHVHGMTRNHNTDAARAMAEIGVEIVEGDFEDFDSLRRAMENVYGAFSVQTPYAEGGVDAEIRQGKAFAEAARSAGVVHFVYSSVGGADRRTGIPFFDSKWRIEECIRKLSLPATILRPVYFMENFSSPQMQPSILNGTLSLPLRPETSLQLITVTDIGGIAAMAFARPELYIGKALEIAGDELTMPQVADRFSRWLERPVRFVPSSIEELRRSSAAVATMYEWFDSAGYECPIATLRGLYPSLTSFESWLRSTNWGKVRQPVGASSGT